MPVTNEGLLGFPILQGYPGPGGDCYGVGGRSKNEYTQSPRGMELPEAMPEMIDLLGCPRKLGSMVRISGL